MEDNLVLAADTCCDVITTCETPICQCSKPITSDCIETTCNEEDPIHMEFAKLAAVLQESVLHSWKLHLKAKKYSVHVILEEYYKDALDIIDGLIEHYQGVCKCDIVGDEIPLMCVKNDDPVIYFTDLKEYLLNFANDPNKFNEKTFEIKSDIDDLLRLIDSTLYKLSHLTESKIKSFDAFVYEDFN
jgi:hypothetical protein